VFRRVHQLVMAGPTHNAESLSSREREILEMIARGYMNKEIARSLSITLCTVKNHVHNILDKLKVRHRREAARYARTHGIVNPVSSCAEVPASSSMVGWPGK
jgi:DNA-binding NarL/FixJ family response regulator